MKDRQYERQPDSLRISHFPLIDLDSISHTFLALRVDHTVSWVPLCLNKQKKLVHYPTQSTVFFVNKDSMWLFGLQKAPKRKLVDLRIGMNSLHHLNASDDDCRICRFRLYMMEGEKIQAISLSLNGLKVKWNRLKGLTYFDDIATMNQLNRYASFYRCH